MMKILKSLSLVVAVAAVAGGATYAYFSDKETASGNSVTAGTLDLILNENGATPLFTVDNVYPSWTSQAPVLFRVKNAGTIIGHLQFTQEGTNFVDDEGIASNSAEFRDDSDLAVGDLCNNLEAQVKNVTDSNTVLAAWQPVKTLQPTGNVQLNGGEEKTLSVEFRVPGTVDNRIQGDKCAISLGLRLVQDVNQNGRADEDENL